MDVIDQLIAHGKSQPEIELNPGATDAELQAFEQSHEVTLPTDLRALLQRANGLANTAEYLAEFYGLDQIEPARVRFGIEQVPDLFVIGGAMIDCPAYAIGLHETNHGSVFEIGGASDNPIQVASSYSNFISMYLAEPDSLALCLSSYAAPRADRPAKLS